MSVRSSSPPMPSRTPSPAAPEPPMQQGSHSFVRALSLVGHWDPTNETSSAEVMIYAKITPRPRAIVPILQSQSLVDYALVRVVPLLPDGSSPRTSPGVVQLQIPIVKGRKRAREPQRKRSQTLTTPPAASPDSGRRRSLSIDGADGSADFFCPNSKSEATEDTLVNLHEKDGDSGDSVQDVAFGLSTVSIDHEVDEGKCEFNGTSISSPVLTVLRRPAQEPTAKAVSASESFPDEKDEKNPTPSMAPSSSAGSSKPSYSFKNKADSDDTHLTGLTMNSTACEGDTKEKEKKVESSNLQAPAVDKSFSGFPPFLPGTPYTPNNPFLPKLAIVGNNDMAKITICSSTPEAASPFATCKSGPSPVKGGARSRKVSFSTGQEGRKREVDVYDWDRIKNGLNTKSHHHSIRTSAHVDGDACCLYASPINLNAADPTSRNSSGTYCSTVSAWITDGGRKAVHSLPNLIDIETIPQPEQLAVWLDGTTNELKDPAAIISPIDGSVDDTLRPKMQSNIPVRKDAKTEGLRQALLNAVPPLSTYKASDMHFSRYDNTSTTLFRDERDKTLKISFPNNIRTDDLVVEIKLKLKPFQVPNEKLYRFFLCALPVCSNPAVFDFSINDKSKNWALDAEKTEISCNEDNRIVGRLNLKEGGSLERNLIIGAAPIDPCAQPESHKVSTKTSVLVSWSLELGTILDYEILLEICDVTVPSKSANIRINTLLVHGPTSEKDLSCRTNLGEVPSWEYSARGAKLGKRQCQNARLLQITRTKEDVQEPIIISFKQAVTAASQRVYIPSLEFGNGADIESRVVILHKAALPVTVICAPHENNWSETIRQGGSHAIGSRILTSIRPGEDLQDNHLQMSIETMQLLSNRSLDMLHRRLRGNHRALFLPKLVFEFSEHSKRSSTREKPLHLRMKFFVDLPERKPGKDLISIALGSFVPDFVLINRELAPNGTVFIDDDELIIMSTASTAKGSVKRFECFFVASNDVERYYGRYEELELPRVRGCTVGRAVGIFEKGDARICSKSSKTEWISKFINGRVSISGQLAFDTKIYLQHESVSDPQDLEQSPPLTPLARSSLKKELSGSRSTPRTPNRTHAAFARVNYSSPSFALQQPESSGVSISTQYTADDTETETEDSENEGSVRRRRYNTTSNDLPLEAIRPLDGTGDLEDVLPISVVIEREALFVPQNQPQPAQQQLQEPEHSWLGAFFSLWPNFQYVIILMLLAVFILCAAISSVPLGKLHVSHVNSTYEPEPESEGLDTNTSLYVNTFAAQQAPLQCKGPGCEVVEFPVGDDSDVPVSKELQIIEIDEPGTENNNKPLELRGEPKEENKYELLDPRARTRNMTPISMLKAVVMRILRILF